MHIKNIAIDIKKRFLRFQKEIMAPGKFGLFKARSRDNQEQPSTENLLHNSSSSDHVALPTPATPSTSKGMDTQIEPDTRLLVNLSLSQQDCNDEDASPVHVGMEEPMEDVAEHTAPIRRPSETSTLEDTQILYQPLQNPASVDATSLSTLNDTEEQTLIAEDSDAATSCDAVSLQFDETSIAPNEDLSVYCGTMKKNKRIKKVEKQLRDIDMWKASNVEVMQHLLSGSCSLDEQYKWEAIATARGLCTLRDNCTCPDCRRGKYLTGITDGDGGLGAAQPFFNTISAGCQVQ